MYILIIVLASISIAVGFVMPGIMRKYVKCGIHLDILDAYPDLDMQPNTKYTYAGHTLFLKESRSAEDGHLCWNMYVDGGWSNCVHYDYKGAVRGIKTIAINRNEE